jgi:hypothetical protein
MLRHLCWNVRRHHEGIATTSHHPLYCLHPWSCDDAEIGHETIEGGSHDQADAEWIVIRTQLRGHNDAPFGRILYVLVTIKISNVIY